MYFKVVSCFPGATGDPKGPSMPLLSSTFRSVWWKNKLRSCHWSWESNTNASWISHNFFLWLFLIRYLEKFYMSWCLSKVFYPEHGCIMPVFHINPFLEYSGVSLVYLESEIFFSPCANLAHGYSSAGRTPERSANDPRHFLVGWLKIQHDFRACSAAMKQKENTIYKGVVAKGTRNNRS